MTDEKEKPENDAKAKTSDGAGGPEKPVSATNELDLRDEVNRRAVIFASALMLVLTAPVVLPVEYDRSLWDLTRYDSTGRVILLLVFAWPVCLALLGIVRGIRRRVPGKTLLIVATVFSWLQALPAALLMVGLLWDAYRARESPFVWLAAGAVLFSLATLVRSSFRNGWQRWQMLVASMALLPVMILLALIGAERNAAEHSSQGGWVFLFATAALLPFIGETVFSKRA